MLVPRSQFSPAQCHLGFSAVLHRGATNITLHQQQGKPVAISLNLTVGSVLKKKSRSDYAAFCR